MRSASRAVITGAVVAGALSGAALAVGAADGAGAELPAVAYQAWCNASRLCTYAIRDSGAGIEDLKSGAADWVGVDEELSANQVREAGGPVTYYPTMLSGIAVAVNIPGIDGHHVQLRGTTLGEIFSGAVRDWNDRRIREVNLHHPMPKSLPITLCVPAHPSGTSWDFSDYLGKVSATFRSRVGAASMEPRWKGTRIVRAAHVTEVGECMARTEGSITFLPVADAMREGLSDQVIAVGKREKVTYGRGVKTRVIEHNVFMHPTEDEIVKAGHYAARNLKGDLTIDLTNSRARGAYPIAVATWAIVRSDRPMKASTRRMLRYFLSDGAQRMLQGLGYAPLPRSLLARARAHLAAAR